MATQDKTPPHFSGARAPLAARDIASKATHTAGNVACFAQGTRIATVMGELFVEDLREGDLVFTLDHGFQELRRVLSRTITSPGAVSPIVIKKGALGNVRDLLVSPYHRMLMRGWRAELLFGVNEVLATAQSLINGDTIFQMPCEEVTYFHLVFDTHEIILAEQCLTESYHPDALNDEAKATHEETLGLFPELSSEFELNFNLEGQTARRCLEPYEAKLLLDHDELN